MSVSSILPPFIRSSPCLRDYLLSAQSWRENLVPQSFVTNIMHSLCLRSSPYKFRAVLGLGFVFSLFILHSIYFGYYISDDAGISFSYAKNLAEGYGLVLSAGGSKVWGYSNFLWVVILAVFAKVGLSLIIVSKVLGILLGIGSIMLVYTISKQLSGNALGRMVLLPLFAPLMLAGSTTFVFWHISGLENALYCFLILCSSYFYLRDKTLSIRTSLLLLGIALTRPEGILFFLVTFAHSIFHALHQKQKVSKKILLAIIVFVIGYVAYLLFHYQYFGGYLVPNTYFAKASQRQLSRVVQYALNPQDRGRKYLQAFLVDYRLNYLLIFMILPFLGAQGRVISYLASLLAGVFFYVLFVGGDWWPQYRFMTPTLPLIYLLVQDGFYRIGKSLPRYRRFLFSGIVILTMLFLIEPSVEYSRHLKERWPVSFQAIGKRGLRFREMAATLSLTEAKYLEPDVGGTAFYSGLTIIDLGQLADIHLARYKYYPPFFRDYVFKEQRPEFIHTHGVWTQQSKITTYPELKSDYVPVREYTDEYGIHGDYIRKDLFIVSNPEIDYKQFVDFGDISFLGYNISPHLIKRGREIRLTLFWTKSGEIKHDYSVKVKFVHAQGETAFIFTHPLIYGWYPPTKWGEGEIVRESRKIRLPSSALEGEYRICITLFDEATIRPEVCIGKVRVNDVAAEQMAQSIYRLHQEHAASGDWRRAFETIQQVLAIEPGVAEYKQAYELTRQCLLKLLCEQGFTELKSGHIESAESYLKEARAIDRFDKCILRALQEISAFYYRKGIAEEKQHNYEKAFTNYLKAVELYPGNSWALRKLEDVRLKRAFPQAYIDLGLKEELIRQYEELVQGGIAISAEALKSIVNEYLRLGDQAGALEAISKLPETIDNLTYLSLLYSSTGQLGELSKVKERFHSLIERPQRAILEDKLEFLGYTLRISQNSKPQLELYFTVLNALGKEYRVFMHAFPETPDLLDESRKMYGFANLDHNPPIPTSQWVRGMLVRDVCVLQLKPGKYRIKFGFWNRQNGERLLLSGTDKDYIDIGWVKVD